MKKILSIIVIMGLLAGMTSCSDDKDKSREVSRRQKVVSADHDEPRENDSVMLTVSNQNWGEVCEDDDYWVSDNYTIYYDGSMEYVRYHHLSGGVTDTFQLSDEDYEKIYDLAYGCYLDGSLEGYWEDACDGSSWTYTFYEPDGTAHQIYSGYSYGNDQMNVIQDLLDSVVSEG